jgi:hypothetical protein
VSDHGLSSALYPFKFPPKSGACVFELTGKDTGNGNLLTATEANDKVSIDVAMVNAYSSFSSLQM